MVREQKIMLRKSIGEKRKRLDAEAIASSNQQIIRNLLDLPQYRQAKVIFCFVATEYEVDTKPVILDALVQGKCVCVPRCISKGIMKAYEIKGLGDLKEGKYGIPEPKEGCVCVEASEIDLVIVPCVACDTHGHRLGYGGGFYDRYLENQSFATAVLCRSALLCDDMPTEEHDVLINIVVTDQRIYHSNTMARLL